MKVNLPLIASVLAIQTLLASCDESSLEKPIEPATITGLSGLNGNYDPTSDVFRVEIPRTELAVSAQGVKLTPGLGLSAWAAFTGTTLRTVLIGEVPLLEEELDGFLRLAVESGVDITSIHNEYLGDSPRVMSLHFEASGSQEQLARMAGAVLKNVASHSVPRENVVTQALEPKDDSLNLEPVDRYLWKGDWDHGAYVIRTGRGTELSGIRVGKSMGVTSWAAFAGTNDHAIVNGDLASLEGELKKEIKALLDAHIHIVSIHAHLTREVPRVVFIHFWGAGKLEDLALGVKNALKKEKNFRGST
jgi:hypothetical protein